MLERPCTVYVYIIIGIQKVHCNIVVVIVYTYNMYAYIHDVPEHCINVLVSDMQTIFRASQEDNIPFGQPTLFCSWTVLPLASRKQATSYGLSVQPSKAECCPTAQVRKTQWNFMRLTNLLVILRTSTGVPCKHY